MLSTFVMAVISERSARQAAVAYKYALAAAAAAEMTAAIAAEDEKIQDEMQVKRMPLCQAGSPLQASENTMNKLRYNICQ